MNNSKKKEKINITKEELKKIYDDYVFDVTDTMRYDDETLNYLTKFNNLSIPDKTIMALYSHYRSQRKVSAILGVSRTTLIKQLNEIKKQILS